MHIKRISTMKRIILAAATLGILTTGAFAQALNSDGEPKYDYASQLQAGEVMERDFDFTPTASIGDGIETPVISSDGDYNYASSAR